MLDWQVLEATVAQGAISQYQQLRNDNERRGFLQGLRVASQELYRLANSADVNYHHPQMGVAYSLWYHMMRVENIYMALDAAHKIKSLPLHHRILDIGAGTGSGTMAINFWLYRQFWSKAQLASAHFMTAEPAPSMQAMAALLFKQLLQHLPNVSSHISLKDNHIHNLEEAAALSADEKFDLILLSYTFCVPNSKTSQALSDQVLEVATHLQPHGILLFLTPNNAEKVQFMNSLAARLEKQGLHHQRLSIPRARWMAPARNPVAILQVRRELSLQAERLGLGIIYDMSNLNEQPYYGFYAMCDLFHW